MKLSKQALKDLEEALRDYEGVLFNEQEPFNDVIEYIDGKEYQVVATVETKGDCVGKTEWWTERDGLEYDCDGMENEVTTITVESINGKNVDIKFEYEKETI